MEKVLLTGASGFIGRRVAAAAAEKPDWDVYALSSGRKGCPQGGDTCHSNVHGVTADLCRPDQIDALLEKIRPDIIIHLAWEVAAAGFGNSDSNLIWMESSLHLLRTFSSRGGRRFIFGGTCDEYRRWDGRFSEDQVLHERTVYSESKAAFAAVGERFCANAGIGFVPVKIFSVYGENDRPNRAIPMAIRTFLRNDRFVCKGPNSVWDYIHVDDVANALVQIAKSDYCGAVNVGSGRPHLMRDVFMLIADKMNCHTLLSFEDDLENVTVLVADPAVLNKEIGYTCKVDFSEGLDRTIAWWKLQNEKEIESNE